VNIAYKTVRKLMKELHIICKIRKKRYRYISKYRIRLPYILQRDFKKKIKFSLGNRCIRV
jgi:hypothetical protein